MLVVEQRMDTYMDVSGRTTQETKSSSCRGTEGTEKSNYVGIKNAKDVNAKDFN